MPASVRTDPGQTPVACMRWDAPGPDTISSNPSWSKRSCSFFPLRRPMVAAASAVARSLRLTMISNVGIPQRSVFPRPCKRRRSRRSRWRRSTHRRPVRDRARHQRTIRRRTRRLAARQQGACRCWPSWRNGCARNEHNCSVLVHQGCGSSICESTSPSAFSASTPSRIIWWHSGVRSASILRYSSSAAPVRARRRGAEPGFL